VPTRWRQYLDKVPKDAWDQDFIYVSPGVNKPFELRSVGPDRKEGTEDDLDVWNL
jgi:general secretion pathway protein G